MVTVNNKIIIKDLIIPDNHVRIWVSNKKDFFNMITSDDKESEGLYFFNGKEYFIFGEGMVFIYEE